MGALLGSVGVAAVVGLLLPTGTPRGAGVLDATWTPPATNFDGSPLTDVASYRVYYAVSQLACGLSKFVEVPSPSSGATSQQLLLFRLSGLVAGTRYEVAVSAVNTARIESLCSPAATAIARDEATASAIVTVGIAGAGRVVSAPGPLECGSACTREHARGAAIVLTPTPAPGSTFTGWAVTGPSAVTAVFTPATAASH